MINPEDYYENNGNDLPEYMQTELLNWMRVHHSLAHSAFKRRDMHAYNQYNLQMNAFLDALEILGIKIGYDWVSHRQEWFFPTYEDALLEEDWEFQSCE